jgi:c-di-GMP-binding flagellar brake protein YcgR
MDQDSQAQEILERRQAPRADVDGDYVMRLDPLDGREPITCTLLDFSVTGMRLQLPENVVLPETVNIVVGPVSHDCRVVWRKDTVVGIDFIDEHHSIF